MVLLYWPDHAEEDQINVGRWTGTTWCRGYATEPTMWAEIHRPGARPLPDEIEIKGGSE